MSRAVQPAVQVRRQRRWAAPAAWAGGRFANVGGGQGPAAWAAGRSCSVGGAQVGVGQWAGPTAWAVGRFDNVGGEAASATEVMGSFGNVGGGQDPQRGRRAGPRSAARSTAARWAGTTTRAVRTGSATSAVGRSGDVGGGHVRRRRQWAVPATWMPGVFDNQGGRAFCTSGRGQDPQRGRRAGYAT